ncbi:MAG: tetratricopeptide repeat protein [Hahellaceae bacterium]|nr:tetratricopeptide repeat protein [Hahellaceae bacterium]
MPDSAWVKDVTLENFQADVIERSLSVPVVIDVWASWCAPCKQLMPLLEKLAAEYEGGFELVKVNADEQQQLVAQLSVRSLPTVFLLQDGRLKDHFTGALPESELRKWLGKHVTKRFDPIAASRALVVEGHLDDALAVLLEAHEKQTSDLDVLTEIAAVNVRMGHFVEASDILDSLPDDRKASQRVKQLQTSIAYASKAPDLPDWTSLEATLARDPEDSAALQAMGQKKLVAGEHEQAMALLLKVCQQDPANVERRQVFLEALTLLGAESPLARDYRRRLYALLH